VWREEEEEVRRSWGEGCGVGFDWWVGGGRKVDRILKKRSVEMRLETGKMLEDDWLVEGSLSS
jgi:hypothetical protein